MADTNSDAPMLSPADRNSVLASPPSWRELLDRGRERRRGVGVDPTVEVVDAEQVELDAARPSGEVMPTISGLWSEARERVAPSKNCVAL